MTNLFVIYRFTSTIGLFELASLLQALPFILTQSPSYTNFLVFLCSYATV